MVSHCEGGLAAAAAPAMAPAAAAVSVVANAADVPATTHSTAASLSFDATTGVTSGHRLLHQLEYSDEVSNTPRADAGISGEVPSHIAFRLYTSHFLSTWNSRLFEFGAALFLTSIFPGTLLPVSIYSLVRNAGYIVFAQPLGSWINKGNRLHVIRASIVGQRVPVAISCALLLSLHPQENTLQARKDVGIFAVMVILAVVEKLCSTMNSISVERDWVVVITEGNELARRKMNARMRRIDLFCKLMGPLAISFVAIASIEIAIYTTLGMNVASVLVEYVFIEQVYWRVSALGRETLATAMRDDIDLRNDSTGETGLGDGRSRGPTALLIRAINNILPVESLPFYVKHPAFLPSLALSLLYFTVLSFSGQMITYLISVGYSSFHVGIARVGSTIFEISATWAAPILMRRIGVVRAGIWSLAWQMACLAGALGWYFSKLQGLSTNSIMSATGLAVGVALSRMGLWGYDLSAQTIIQNEVEDDHRGTFSAVEASFQNLFEMLSYITTIIFSRPEQFQYPVVISVVAVYTAGGLYAYFLRKRRGHLFHAPPCIRMNKYVTNHSPRSAVSTSQ